jgi:hypothetical protein
MSTYLFNKKDWHELLNGFRVFIGILPEESSGEYESVYHRSVKNENKVDYHLKL